MKKCSRCPNPATEHITEICEGNAVAVHLCRECAREYLESDPLDQPHDSAMEIVAKLEALVDKSDQQPHLVCSNCQITFAQFRENGRLGCPLCYEEFAEELAPLLENVHESSQHEGKRPARSLGQPEEQHEILRLRTQQKEAIEKEDYELAARLRDQIAAIENGDPVDE